MLQKIEILDFITTKGLEIERIPLFYEVFGKPLLEGPVVLVNHALTGNSDVCGPNGWWNGLIGEGKCIDTDKYTVLSFNIPGNGYDGDEKNLITDYTLFTARDIAAIFEKGIKQLNVQKLYAAIGGSVGGGIAWELAALAPGLINHLIPVATDWKSTDWLKANCLIQEQILLNSKNPVHDARLHAMLIYRSPESFKEKFHRTFNGEKGMYNVESWLFHHGKKLNERFTLSAYKELNYILANIDITEGRGCFKDLAANIKSNIHIVSVNSDGFFTAKEDEITFQELKEVKQNVWHHTIDSVHGHDAFLIEFDQLSRLLSDVF
ncbi:alpha/beta fold hydrolase [Aquimarina sp. AD1]|uniref:alpha/beta fold hydrolase n=1 Tax=Aquimarina sp. (strain AD1) TaxID=1714848 RepID=UPI000E521BAF|nr:alpha/beta fold hydrolase [Aquimarina sp. AD1]AXT58030.1 alpha/beta fold hydrolase [Aquimarina sp. AD1]RKN16452.1 alpha/beta fold hydrolase [Aquimarina sp. AD1]